MKKLLALALAIVLALSLAACDSGNGGGNNTPSGNPASSPSGDPSGGDTPSGGEVWSGSGDLELYPAYAAVPQGYSLYLDWNTPPGSPAVEWSSSDTSVVTVDADGLITAVSEGEAVITASVKNKPDAKETCGIRVVEFLDNENALNEIVIWEDSPPSLFYQAAVFGKKVASAEVEAEDDFEPGENIPISLSPDDEDFLASGAVYTGQSGSIELLSAAVRTPKRPIKLNKKKTREKLKKNTVWTIVVAGRRVWYTDYLDRTTIETFNCLVRKTGGDSPVGLYGGTAEYTRLYDHTTHYAKYPDHSVCMDCNQRWKENFSDGVEVIGFPPPPLGSDVTRLEWRVSHTAFYKGYYTSEETPGSLFEIKQTDKVRLSSSQANGLAAKPLLFTPGNSLSGTGNGLDYQFLSDELAPLVPPQEEYDELAPLVPVPEEDLSDFLAPLARLKWFELDALVHDYYTRYENTPTNMGNNWGGTYNIDTTVGLEIVIYTDNTVRINDYYFGTLMRRVK